MTKKLIVFLFMVLIISFQTACTGNAPKQIASLSTEKLIAQYPSQMIIVYHAYLELKVTNVDKTADRAVHMAYEYGGYLASSQSWYIDGQTVTSVEVVVPTINFEYFLIATHNLGELVNESIRGETISGTDYLSHFSTITIQLRPGGISELPIDISIWNPLITAQNAIQVFLTIFGFLADIIIWVVIVGGPFFLLYLIVRVILRRLRRLTP